MNVPPIVTSVMLAVNSGDTEGFLKLFAEDGSVDDWGDVYRGRDEIQTWSDRELIGAEASFALLSAEQHGAAASMMVQVGGKGFNGPSRFSFVLAGGRIRQMSITAG